MSSVCVVFWRKTIKIGNMDSDTDMVEAMEVDDQSVRKLAPNQNTIILLQEMWC